MNLYIFSYRGSYFVGGLVVAAKSFNEVKKVFVKSCEGDKIDVEIANNKHFYVDDKDINIDEYFVLEEEIKNVPIIEERVLLNSYDCR